jgi:hypothetical protein
MVLIPSLKRNSNRKKRRLQAVVFQNINQCYVSWSLLTLKIVTKIHFVISVKQGAFKLKATGIVKLVVLIFVMTAKCMNLWHRKRIQRCNSLIRLKIRMRSRLTSVKSSHN